MGTIALVVFSARSSFADHYVVPSGSMLPTVELGDRIFVDKLAYGLRVPFTRRYLLELGAPERGDVVVLASPVDGVTLLKRVVALPGDRVEVRAGRVLINGSAAPVEPDGSGLREVLGDGAHGVRLTHGGGPDLAPVTVPEARYLVLGDNRGESADGRYFGLVEKDRLRGRAVAIYWRAGGFTWSEL